MTGFEKFWTFTNAINAEHSGSRVLNCRSMSCWFEPNCWQSHCVVSLSKTLYPLLWTGSTQEGLSRHDWKIVDWDVKNWLKQINQGHYLMDWSKSRKNFQIVLKFVTQSVTDMSSKHRQGSHRLEKYLNIQDCLEKSLKFNLLWKLLEKTLKGLEEFLNFTIYRRIQQCFRRPKSV